MTEREPERKLQAVEDDDAALIISAPVLRSLLPQQDGAGLSETSYCLTIFNAAATRTATDFKTLDRAARRSSTVTIDLPFPRRRFNKMSLADDPRSHMKTINLTNAFLRCCHENAHEEDWWLAFLTPSKQASSATIAEVDAAAARLQARQWNQYFTQENEASMLINAALKFIDDQVVVFMEPCAGTGSVQKLLPVAYKIVAIDIDPSLCHTHGWFCGDFLTLEHHDLDLVDVPPRAICVVTNPPFVQHCKTERTCLASQFIHKSLTFADTAVMLLPERFAKTHRNVAPDGFESFVVGNVMPSRFDLGKDHFKVITQPTIIVVFRRRK